MFEVGMKIQYVVGINGHTLLVYCCADTSYRFSIIDMTGKSHTCPHSFPSVSSATFMGTAAIQQTFNSDLSSEQ